jgi:integrase
MTDHASAAVVPAVAEFDEYEQFLAFKRMKAAANSGNGSPSHIPARKVRDLWNEWVATLKPVPEYIASHERWFCDFEFAFEGRLISVGSQPWTELVPRMGQAWWAELRKQLKDAGRETIATPRGELLSAGYCNRIRTSASGMFSYHVDLAVKAGSKMRASVRGDEVTENPISAWPRAQSAELGERLGSFNDEEHLADFLQHAHPVLRKMATLSSRCGGMRKSEVRLLRFKWINWDAGTITLPKDANKNGESRTFPVEDESMAILQAQRDAHASYSEYVFPNGRGNQPYSDGAMNSWQLEAAAAWGQLIDGERPCFHHLRHTWAKWSLIRGMPVTQVMEYGGWKSYDVAKKYMKASAAMLEQAKNRSRLTIREAIAAQSLNIDRKAPRRARYESPLPERGAVKK